jgi:hypothetical protein
MEDVDRLAKVRVSTGLLQSVLKGESIRGCDTTTAPGDLEILGVEQPRHAIGYWFYAIVSSKRFKKVKPGEDLPIIDPFIYHNG